ALSVPASTAQVAAGSTPVDPIQVSSSDDVTRIAIETRGKAQSRDSGHLRNPDRLYYDLAGVNRPHGNAAGTIGVGDRLVKRIRFSQRTEEVTRIVFDLSQPVE